MKFLVLIFAFTLLFAAKPELFLLNKYNKEMNISGWYMSEKLDGVRAYWDGEKLISRNGKVFSAPAFFVKEFPKYELDGELWSKHSDFSNISSIVNKQKSHDGWKQLTYNVFEVPNAEGNLTTRLEKIQVSRYLQVIKQIKVKNKNYLDTFLESVEEKNGEGIVVRDGTLPYYIGRNNSSLKVKSYIDEECEVVGYTSGKGKYQNLVGSLLCKMDDTNVIKIGSGLTDAQRENPPSVGTIITFKYYGLTSKGNPRFPIFLRIRR